MIRALVLVLALYACAAGAAPPANPKIDMRGYLAVASEAARYRESRRLDEREFMRLAAEPGTIVLDARSADKYALRHVAARSTSRSPTFRSSRSRACCRTATRGS